MPRLLIVASILFALAAVPAAADAQDALQRATIAGAPALAGPVAALAWFTGGLGGWLPALAILALLVTVGVLVAFAVTDWRSYRQRGTRRGYRHRRTAHERFAPSVEIQRRAAPPAASAAPAPPPDNTEDEDELLRQLLGQ
jgi:hypothetical protein